MTLPRDAFPSGTSNVIVERKIIKKLNTMKVKASVKKRSEDCKIVRRKGRVYIICKKNPKFKMRQG